jgi:hypothetical protein
MQVQRATTAVGPTHVHADPTRGRRGEACRQRHRVRANLRSEVAASARWVGFMSILAFRATA